MGGLRELSTADANWYLRRLTGRPSDLLLHFDIGLNLAIESGG